MKQRKKILFLITKSNWGGAQRYVFDLATKLDPSLFEVVVALGGDGELSEKLNASGIRVVKLKQMQNTLSVIKLLKMIKECTKVIQTEKPDILHNNSSVAGLVGALAGRITFMQTIIFTAHGWAFNEDRSKVSCLMVGIFHWLTILFSHQTITVSNELKDQVRWPFTKRKMTTVYNGRSLPHHLEKSIARNELATHCPDLKKYLYKNWIGTIAELHPTKQHDIAIKAVAKLVADGYAVRHLIIGQGEEYSKLQQLIKKLDLQEHIFLLGDLDEAAQYLKAFDVFVLASRSEALGYVVIEASQAELPIVASKVGGIPEVVQDGISSTLVTPSSPTEFAQAISNYLDNLSLAQTHAVAAKKDSKKFSINKMIAETKRIYRFKSK